MPCKTCKLVNNKLVPFDTVLASTDIPSAITSLLRPIATD